MKRKRSSPMTGNAGHESNNSLPMDSGTDGSLLLDEDGERLELALKLCDPRLSPEEVAALGLWLRPVQMDETLSSKAKAEYYRALRLGIDRHMSQANAASLGPTAR